jgi:hypothetical protein
MSTLVILGSLIIILAEAELIHIMQSHQDNKTLRRTILKDKLLQQKLRRGEL